MPIPMLTGDPTVKKTTTIVAPKSTTTTQTETQVDPYDYIEKHINGFVDRASKKKGGVVDTFAGGNQTKDEIKAVQMLAKKAAEYKKIYDAGFADLKKLDPTKTELTEAELNKLTNGKGAEALKYINLWTKYRNATTRPEIPLDQKQVPVPSFGGDGKGGTRYTYSPDKGAATLANYGMPKVP